MARHENLLVSIPQQPWVTTGANGTYEQLMLRSSLCSIGGAFLPRPLPRLHVVWMCTPVAVGSTDVSSCPCCLVCNTDECVYVHGSIIRLHGWNHHDVMVGRLGPCPRPWSHPTWTLPTCLPSRTKGGVTRWKEVRFTWT